jgi:cysteinyl-tRNA synthetase
MLLLTSHYRGPITVTQKNIDDSVKNLATLDSFAARTAAVAGAAPDVEVLAKFRERMDDDLDTSAALALLFDTVRRANVALDSDADAGALVAAAHEICAAVGLVLNAGGDVPADVAAQAAALDAARAAKDFAAADALRAELQAAGWTVETTKDGTKVRR